MSRTDCLRGLAGVGLLAACLGASPAAALARQGAIWIFPTNDEFQHFCDLPWECEGGVDLSHYL